MPTFSSFWHRRAQVTPAARSSRWTEASRRGDRWPESARAVFHEAALQRFNHSHTGTPTTAALERKIAHLEGGRETVCFATGRSAQPR
ncbi:hypothetical protein FOC34_13250 [Burkholderia multivorans]|nr:hypothetical protein FOC34_13250 [Burkholderia multivorans]